MWSTNKSNKDIETGRVATYTSQDIQIITTSKTTTGIEETAIFPIRRSMSAPNLKSSVSSRERRLFLKSFSTVSSNSNKLLFCGINDISFIDEEDDINNNLIQTYANKREKIPNLCLEIGPPYTQTLSATTDFKEDAVKILTSTYDENYFSINFGENLIQEMITSSIMGNPLSPNAAINAYHCMRHRITKVAKHFIGFTSLPGKIQSVLLKQNADMLISLQGVVFFQCKANGLDQILYSLGTEDRETARTMIAGRRHLNNNPGEDYKLIDYKNFNTLQEKKDNSLSEIRYDKLSSWVGAAVGNDQNLLKILSYVILFCSDFYDECVDSKTKRYIEMKQEGIIRLLQTYVYATNSKSSASRIFGTLIESLSHLRELCYIKKKRKLSQIPSSTLKVLINSKDNTATHQVYNDNSHCSHGS